MKSIGKREVAESRKKGWSGRAAAWLKRNANDMRVVGRLSVNRGGEKRRLDRS